MKLIYPSANYQLRLPTLELREQEILGMCQGKSGRSCYSKVFSVRKSDIPKCSPKDFTRVDGSAHQ